MKTEIWTIENGKLVCNYETYNGHKGVKIFVLTRKYVDSVQGMTYTFKEEGTKYSLGAVTWNTLTNCFTSAFNNTRLTAFIRADLKQL